MKIGIDASFLDSNIKTGVEQYLCNLVFNLAEIDKKNQYILYYNSVRRAKEDFPGPVSSNFERRVIRIPSFNSLYFNKIWSHVLSHFMRKDKVDVAHVMCSSFPKNVSFASVATIHDLDTYRKFAGADNRANAFDRFMVGMVERTVSKADRLIAVSERTRSDITDIFPSCVSKTEVVYPGIDFDKTGPELSQAERVREKYGLGKNNILFVGRLAQNKNIPVLLKAFALLKNRGEYDHKLVIVGKASDGYGSIVNTIRELGIAKNVVVTGYVPQEEIAGFYGASDVFVFPSLSEGFGIPCAEAMSFNVPLILSDISVFREVAGDCAVYFDAASPESLYEALSSLLGDSVLRQALTEKARARVKLFDGKASARKTLAVYESLN